MISNVELGKRVYNRALSDRSGFGKDQLGIDDEIWNEVMEDLGQAIADEFANMETDE